MTDDIRAVVSGGKKPGGPIVECSVHFVTDSPDGADDALSVNPQTLSPA